MGALAPEPRLPDAVRLIAIELRGIAAPLDLVVAAGERVVLVGPSGAGKTSCLRVVAGLDAPRAGRVVLDGRDVTGVPIARREVALIPAHATLHDHLSVFENVAFGLRMRRIDERELRDRVAAAVRATGVEPLLGRRAGHLSGGERQRVALAAAAARAPRLFLFDEPRPDLAGVIAELLASCGAAAITTACDQRATGLRIQSSTCW